MEKVIVPQEMAPGSLIADRYEVRKVLGYGHVGLVLHAYDTEQDRDVALKIIHEWHMANHETMARFVRGATLAYELDHPGIVKLYESHSWNGLLFYAMEYLDGKTLRNWLAEHKQMNFGSAMHVIKLLADALDYAHKTTVHRDLSPECIMVLPDGSVRLLDFGLAKHDDRFKGLTIAGTNMGKLMYMAPEQELNAGQVDYRADLYSLGIVLFEMLVGHTPQIGRRLRDCCPDLPPGIDMFMRKALALSPEDRFASAGEFRDALLPLYEQYKEHMAGKPYKADQPGLWTRVKTFWNRLLGRKPLDRRIAERRATERRTSNLWKSERERRIGERRAGKWRK